MNTERAKVLAAFIRGQAGLTDKHPHQPGPGSVKLNHEEALLCAEALDPAGARQCRGCGTQKWQCELYAREHKKCCPDCDCHFNHAPEAEKSLNHYLLRVALQSVAFHISMGKGNFDNPFQHDRERALEYLRTLAPDPRPVPPTTHNHGNKS